MPPQEPVDLENIPGAIANLEAGLQARIEKFGKEDPIVVRKTRQIQVLKLKLKPHTVASVQPTKPS